MIPLLPYGIPAPIALPFLEKLLAAFLRHKKLMLLLGCLTIGVGIGGFYLTKRVSEIDPILYGPELRSAKAFALYEIGAYRNAGNIYRAEYGRYLESEGSAPAWLVSTLRRDYPEATRLAEQELHTNPESIEGLLTLAQVAYDCGDFTRASEYTRQVLSLYWDNTDALLLAALIATRDPSKGDPFLFLNTALRTGTAARNIMSFLNTLEITGYLQHITRDERPYALLAHYYRVLRIYDAGMTGRVMRAARRAIRQGDHPSESFLSIGLMHEKSGLRHEALEAYNESVRIGPTQALAYYWASRLYSRYDFPHEYLLKKQAFRAAPTDTFYIGALYGFLMDKKEFFAAKQLMEEALRIDPENLVAHVFLASALQQLGEKQRVLGLYQKMISLQPSGPYELEQQAWAAEWLGKDDARESLLHRSVNLDRGRPDPHKQLARLYKKQERVPEALKEFEIAFAMEGYESPEEIQGFCQLYEKIGDSGHLQICMQAYDRLLKSGGPYMIQRVME
jgi:tetratricopeptide (TPR) repeat protein